MATNARAHWRANSAVNPLENHAAPFGVIGYGDPNTLTGIEKAFLFLQAESIFIPLREMYSYRISHKTEGDHGFDLGLLGDLTQWLIAELSRIPYRDRHLSTSRLRM